MLRYSLFFKDTFNPAYELFLGKVQRKMYSMQCGHLSSFFFIEPEASLKMEATGL